MRTPEQVKDEFRRRGMSINEWARNHHVSAALVHQVLSGKKRCVRGQSHDIAVMLGLKEGLLSSDVSELFSSTKEERPPEH